MRKKRTALMIQVKSAVQFGGVFYD
ncbi:hypothetical protein CGSHi22121_09390 [Haemophilus influenzae 22.1-21]|uniref:Uncharacterized protein n=1 Tax=Haemophilus influenzae (strain PittGG) TaxID=374931 RepID=A5UFR5_HAEIG|nr:hypothetical protein CGSHiGG_03105 [Haemophilus influenzae PittGG]EDJ88230.1 hypothetical protein CGSHi22121_09390 [Haemophilus influenzae 22.1-21]